MGHGSDSDIDSNDADHEGDGLSELPSAQVEARFTPGFLFDDAPTDWAGALDLEELCHALLGLPVADAEDEVREALKKAGGDVTDADTLAVLLRIFRLVRDSAVEGYDSWDACVEYCARLSTLCDRNFLGGGDFARPQALPAKVVGPIYAECGRTLALAGKITQSREHLLKALHVFSLAPPDAREEEEKRQMSACHASLARVLRRLGQPARAHEQYLQAIQVLADVYGADVAGLVTEYSEVIVEVGEDAAVSPVLLEVICAFVEEKLGAGSEEHLRALRELADACKTICKPALSVPMLATLARLLRDRCEFSFGRCAETDAEAVELEAAEALEAATSASLQEGNLQDAVSSWTLAIAFREYAEDEGSELLQSMRQTLEVLEQAAEQAPDAPPMVADQTPTDQGVEHQEEDKLQEQDIAAPSTATKDRDDEKKDERVSEQIKAKPVKPSLTQSVPKGLRPHVPTKRGYGSSAKPE